MGFLFKCPIIVQPNANVYSNTPRKMFYSPTRELNVWQ